MKHLILIFLLGSCTPSIYFVATDSNFYEVDSQSVKKKIIYLNQEIAPIGALDILAKSMNKRKWNKMDQYIGMMSKDDQDFIVSIKNMINKEFIAAYNSLTRMSNVSYGCQVEILKTDCLYELGIDSVDYRFNYQNAMNCTHNDKIKSIVKTRYRFYRHEK